jgi:outer membrane autotransporter protein
MNSAHRSTFVFRRKHLLAMAIHSTLLAPLVAHAATGQQVADGISLIVPAGNYATTLQSAHALYALNGGSVVATDADVTTSGDYANGLMATTGGTIDASGVSASTSGYSTAAASAVGPGSAVNIHGGIYSTSGVYAQAISVESGGAIIIDRDSRTGEGAVIHTTSASSRGLAANNGSIVANGVTIKTEGDKVGTLGAEGALAIGGGSVALTDSTIETLGSFASGIYAETGSSLSMRDGAILTKGQGASGAALYGDASGLLSDVDIRTEGAQARGVVSRSVGSVMSVDHGRIATLGSSAYGVHALEGGRADLAGTAIETGGVGAHGILIEGVDSSVNYQGGTISTTGVSSHGIFASEGHVSASGVAIHATGDKARGVEAHAATADLVGVSIKTEGNRADDYSATGVVASDGGSIRLSNSQIETTGYWSDGMVAENAGSSISMRGGNILATGDRSQGAVAYSGNTAISLTDVNVRTEGESGRGIVSSGVSGGIASSITMVGGSVTTLGGDATGAYVSEGAKLDLQDAHVRTEGAGSWASQVNGTLDMNGGSLVSAQYGAINAIGDAAIALTNGVQVIGGNGALLSIADEASAVRLTMNNAVYAEGDIIGIDTDRNGSVQVNTDVALTNGSLWKGRTSAVRDLSVDSNSQWTMTGNSVVSSLSLSEGTIAFAAPTFGDYKTLRVTGDFAGSGGTVVLNSELNAGGALSNQNTDRLLIGGNVVTTGTTWLQVTPNGLGDLTDSNKNGMVDASEGISLVQVAGDSRADAFALRGGYVAAGPWQYTLHAFGPDQADAHQNALGTGDLNWDYRLGNRYVADPDKPVNPGKPDPEEEVKPIVTRPAVVPQLPSYIAAPTALLAYGTQINNTLHQRLGEIRNAPIKDNESLGGEVFARYMGGEYRYSSDRTFSDYGYDFDQQINALQLGGSILAWMGDGGALRAGWALDKGTTRVTPKAADGASRAKYDVNGVSGWLTWQQVSGFYVDAVVGGQRFSGDVGTDLRGNDVATVKANGWHASVETGYPFALGGGWSLEPQAQVTYQSLTFRDIQDADGLTTRIDPVGQTTTRLGARLTKTDKATFAPYLRADVIRTVGGRAKVNAASDVWNISENFAGGRVGTSYRLGAGMTSQLTRSLAVYGEADYQHGTSDNGFRGWAGNIGLRWNF